MWVICGRNVALAVFSNPSAAITSLMSEGFTSDDVPDLRIPPYSEWTDLTGGVLTLRHLTQPSDTPVQLFRTGEVRARCAS